MKPYQLRSQNTSKFLKKGTKLRQSKMCIYFSALCLSLFSMCADRPKLGSQKSENTYKDTSIYYRDLINDTAFYVGLNHYHVSPYNVDSLTIDTIPVIRTGIDSITFYTLNDPYYTYLDNTWNTSGGSGKFKLNDRHLYRLDLSDSEATYIIEFRFYAEDSLLYKHKRSLNTDIYPDTETYKFAGKRIR